MTYYEEKHGCTLCCIKIVTSKRNNIKERNSSIPAGIFRLTEKQRQHNIAKSF